MTSRSKSRDKQKLPEPQTGQIWDIRIGQRIAAVELLARTKRSGWYAVTLDTDRTVYIRSRRRLRLYRASSRDEYVARIANM
jgi:uncharacterized protein YgiM (DUF1202 family)